MADHAGQAVVVGGLGEVGYQPSGLRVADPVARLGGAGSQADQQVTLPRPGAAVQAQRGAGLDPVPAGEPADQSGVDGGVGLKREVVQPFSERKPRGADSLFRAAPVTSVPFGDDQLGQEP